METIIPSSSVEKIVEQLPEVEREAVLNLLRELNGKIRDTIIQLVLIYKQQAHHYGAEITQGGSYEDIDESIIRASKIANLESANGRTRHTIEITQSGIKISIERVLRSIGTLEHRGYPIKKETTYITIGPQISTVQKIVKGIWREKSNTTEEYQPRRNNELAELIDKEILPSISKVLNELGIYFLNPNTKSPTPPVAPLSRPGVLLPFRTQGSD